MAESQLPKYGKSWLRGFDSRTAHIVKMIKWFERHSKLSLGITFIVAIGIFYLSSLTFEPSSKGGVIDIKPMIYHIVAFFMLEFFLLISLIKGKAKELVIFFIGIVMVVLYGISDEIHQIFVPGRVASIADIFLDFVGVALAFLVYFVSLVYRAGQTLKKRESY